MAITYRQLTAADAAPYRDIRLESLRLHPDNFGSDYETQRKLPRLRLEQALLAPVDETFVMGAFDQARLVGLVAFLPFVPRSDAWPRTGVIIQVYVRAAYRGQKVGLMLMRRVLAAAFALPAIDRVMLEVARANVSARRVYEQAGLKIINEDDEAAPEYVMVIDRATWEKIGHA